jgi:hypothetical protein
MRLHAKNIGLVYINMVWLLNDAFFLNLVAIIPNRQTALRSVHKESTNFQLNYNSNSRRNEYETY